jgi:hypothetical protein
MAFDRERQPDWHTYADREGLAIKRPPRAKWGTTECRFHGGSDSMRVNMATGGWCCMNCGAKGGDVLAYHMQAHGLEFIEAARQLGAWIDDGKPAPQQKPAPLPPRAALQVLAFESTLAAVAAGNVAHGVKLTDRDRFRLLTAASRINRIAEAYQ